MLMAPLLLLIPTDFCCGVQQVVRDSESITALMFHPKSEGLLLLAVGTDRGTVTLMKSDNLTSLNHRYPHVAMTQ